ncbi:MAG: hypothetical protein V4622_04530 [Bacteroidota bacterium]
MKSITLYLIILITLIITLFVGLGDKIIFAKSGVERIIPIILIFIGIPFSLYKVLIKIQDSRKKVANITALSVIILGLSFGLWSKYLSENDFKQYGKTIIGEVVKREWTTGNKAGHWVLTASFRYNSKKYLTFSKDEMTRKYNLYDKILVRFSKRNPENNEIILEK